MGRPKKNTANVEAFIAKLEKQCGYSFEELAATVLKSPKTRAAMVYKIMEYRFGKPKEIVSHSGSITVYDAVAKARARVLQFEQMRKKPELLKTGTESETSSPIVSATGTDGES